MTDLDVHLPAIAAGDPDAFARWLAGAEEPLRRSLRRFAASVDTEAILQECLLRTWQVAPRVSPDGRPNALLRMAHRIARNAAIDAVRRRRDQGVDPAWLEEGLGAVEPALPDPVLRKAIAQCREELPPTPASAWSARMDTKGARHDRELAERCGMTLNTFLKNIGRARRLLRECLEHKGITLGAS